MTPEARVLPANDAPVRPERDYVLYWMIAARRTRWSFGLQRAVERARELGRPLLVFEALRVGYRWASVRLHRFVIEGMVDQRARLDEAGITYLPYVEPKPGAGSGLLVALARNAAVVVTDHFPTFFLPRMVRAAGDKLDVRLEAVDGNGVLPLALAPKVFTTAYSFRRHIHKTVRPHLEDFPEADPLDGGVPGKAKIPATVLRRWPMTDLDGLLDGGLSRLPIDPEVGPGWARGGAVAGEARLATFMSEGLSRYGDRNHPDDDATSSLSPWLHFGQVGVHGVLDALFRRDGFDMDSLPPPTGKREGWWGLSPEGEAFLDEVLTWRELGYTFCHLRPDDHEDYDGLPGWALQTLEEHAPDPRSALYDLEALRTAQTGDPLWNAAQRQLLVEGRMHNYLRMLWGKLILGWTRSPREALAVMFELNNRYALDGRDPNSMSGITWVLGRFDRAWGPERPVFGKVRYMTSASTRKKLRCEETLVKWGEEG